MQREQLRQKVALQNALDLAEHASQAKSTFLTNMSHDFRTPMNSISGFASIALDHLNDTDRVRDCLRKIMLSSDHLLSLVNDILDVSRIESGKMSFNEDIVSLPDAVIEVQGMFGEKAAASGVDLTIDVDNVAHPQVVTDPLRLNQILVNTVGNAVKFTPSGGLVTVALTELADAPRGFGAYRLTVSDTGCGMTPEFLDRIFLPFERDGLGYANKTEGTGLGMTITKSLVDLMGGTIEVESEVGKGSLFRVDLELRIPEEQAAGYFWERANIKSMLVADASPAAHAAIADFMEGTGVEVDVAASADEARKLVEARGGYDVVLVGVPWLDDAAVRAADGLRASAETPLLFMLEHTFDQDDDVVLPHGAAVLTKPFFPSMLKQKIEAVRGVGADEDDDLAQVLSGKHFLAAEDNFLNAGILTDLLEMEGATVEIVENGKLVVERFERCEPGEFDAILMDVQMPVMNGHAAARAIRALARPDAATIPIFAMTADAFVEDEKAALAAGMNAHVAKPLEIDELRRAVDRFVEKGRS